MNTQYSTSGARSQTASISFLLIVSAFLLLCCSDQLRAGSYPKDGTFKRLPDSRDYWYYVDNNNWAIKAPDKWTHMMGSLGSTLVLGRVMNSYAAGALVLSFGLFKEYDDAYREGWSYRDIIADALGVLSALTWSDRFQLLCDYNDQTITLKVSLAID
jgi:hypothetical protein